MDGGLCGLGLTSGFQGKEHLGKLSGEKAERQLLCRPRSRQTCPGRQSGQRQGTVLCAVRCCRPHSAVPTAGGGAPATCTPFQHGGSSPISY